MFNRRSRCGDAACHATAGILFEVIAFVGFRRGVRLFFHWGWMGGTGRCPWRLGWGGVGGRASLMYFFAAWAASSSGMPFASEAANAEERVHPVPWVLTVSRRFDFSSVSFPDSAL